MLLWLAAGCATLGGTRQYVSIDSQPRGLEVLDDGAVVGTTPLFHHLERASSHALELRAPGGATTPFRVECGYRWTGSLLANAPAAALGLVSVCMAPAWAAASGVDLLSGAAWSCPESLHVPTSLQVEAEPSCPVYAVALPRHPDEQIARLVAKAWVTRQAARDGCAQVVALDEVEEVLERFGLDHDTGLDVARVQRAWLNEFGHRTGASHLVVFRLPLDRKILKVTPGVYDLHSLSLRPDDALEVDTSEVIAANPLWRWVVRHVRLLPNAVTFSPSLKQFDFVGRGAIDGAIIEGAVSSLPSVIGNWSMGFVEHPARHGQWGVSGGLGPGAFVGYNNRALGLPRDGRVHQTQVTAVHLIGLYGGSVSVHTPLGAISGALGLGLGGARQWNSDGFVGTGVRAYGYAEVSWTGFVSRHLFVKASIAHYQPSSPELVSPDYALQSWQQASFSFGWHLSGFRRRVRGWLSD